MSVLIVLVNDYDITSQQANIKHAVAYAAKFNRTRVRVDWFLSGAPRVKSLISEAQQMSEAISNVSESCILINKHNWHYIHDNRSINIKDNFARLNEWLEFNQSYQEIQVVTSKNYLASRIAETVFPGNKFKWIYSDLIEMVDDDVSMKAVEEKRQRVANMV
jgi:hypothetical protein